MGIGIGKGNLYCEQCKQTFSKNASYMEVEQHLAGHRTTMGEMQDSIICHCGSENCPNYRKDNFFDLYLKEGQFYLVISQHSIPMCEHMWTDAKKQVDESLAYEKEQHEEFLATKWCPHCAKRVPKESEVCPECGAKL